MRSVESYLKSNSRYYSDIWFKQFDILNSILNPNNQAPKNKQIPILKDPNSKCN